jgi:hypothetical protein
LYLLKVIAKGTAAAAAAAAESGMTLDRRALELNDRRGFDILPLLRQDMLLIFNILLQLNIFCKLDKN